MTSAGAKIRAADVRAGDYVQEASDSAAITTTETVVGTLVFATVAGGVYETRWSLKTAQSVAADWFLYSVREDSLTGTSLDGWGVSNDTLSYGRMWTHWILYTASTTETKTLVVTLDRLSGTGNIVRAAKSNYSVRRIA